MIAVLSFDGVTATEAKRQVLELGAQVLRVTSSESGKTVHIEAKLDQRAKDRAALAEFSGELRFAPIRVLSLAAG
jgi:hypothetical protein